MIDRLFSVLAAGGLEPTSRELRDALWLAEHIAVPDLSVPAAPQEAPVSVPEPEKPPVPPKPPGEQPDRAAPPGAGRGELYASGGGTVLPGVAARSPAVPALRGKLALVRALRPLKRRVPSRTEFVVDEDATAMRIADEDLWAPVFRPAATRWLNLALVVDAAPSMVVWRRTVAELRALADQLGAFRQVREFTIDSSADRNTPLAVGRVLAGGHDPATLVDPTGRQIVLVVTDAVGAAWRDGRVDSLLRLWGSAGPTAVVTVLPQRMWGGTGLRAVPAEVRAPMPGMANREWEHRVRGAAADGGPIPVLELSPRWLASWAGLVAGGAGWRGAAVIGPAQPGAPTRAADGPVALVDRFRAAASPTAFQLACYLSAAWLNLPVMRLVQRVMLPDSHTAHLAEVFLGGLLSRCDDGSGDPEQVQYEFLGGVREELNGYLLREDLIEVLRATTEFVADRFGQSFDFAALLADPDGAPLPALGAGSGQPLAYVTATVLAKLGGRYRTLIDRLGELPGSAGAAASQAQVAGLPADLRFTRDHHWVRVVGDRRVRVGLTSFGWRQLGGLTQLQLSYTGTTVARGQAMGLIESPRMATTLQSPVGGVIAAVNHPTYLSDDPGGWLVEIEGVDLSELDTLLTPDEYSALTAAPAGPRLPDPTRSRAVLIGNEPELSRLQSVLTDVTLPGLPIDRCEVLLAQDPPAVFRAVERAAAEAEDLLLVCVSGAGSDVLAAMRSRIAESAASSTVLLAELPAILSGGLRAAHLEIHGTRDDEIIGRFADLLSFGIPDAGSALSADDIVEWGRWTQQTQISHNSSRPIYIARNRAEGMGGIEDRLKYLSGLFEVARRTGSARLLDWAISDLRVRTPLAGPLRAEAMALNAHCEWEMYRHPGSEIGLVTVSATIADAVREFQWLAESDPPRYRAGFADLLELQSKALAAGGHGEQAWESASRSVAVTRSITGGASSLALARSLQHLTCLGMDLGRHGEALAAITEAVKIRRSAPPEHDSLPKMVDCLILLGRCATELEGYAVAMPAYDEAVELCESAWGAGHPYTLDAKIARADLCSRMGDLTFRQQDFSVAELRYREALASWEEVVAADSGHENQRNLCLVHERLGDIGRATGDRVAADESYRAALAIADRLAAAASADDADQRRRNDLLDKLFPGTDEPGTVPAETGAGGILWPLVKALARLPCMTALGDRAFVVRLTADRLGYPLQVDESPRAHAHIFNIVEVCDRIPDGLNSLLDVVRELDRGSSYLRDVEQLIAARTTLPLWPEVERQELFALLRGVIIADLPALYRQVAGENAPELPAGVGYREVFLTLETLNARADGLPKAIEFVERVASGRGAELAMELRRWVDRQASRLGVITELIAMRRRGETDEPRRNVISVGGDVSGLVVAGDHNLVPAMEVTPRFGFVLDIVGFTARTARAQVELTRRLTELVNRVKLDLWSGQDAKVTVVGDSATVFLSADVDVSREVPRLIYTMVEHHSRDTGRYRDRMRLRMAVAFELETPPRGFSSGYAVSLTRLILSRVLRQAILENEDVDLAVLVEHGVDDTVTDNFRDISTLVEVEEKEFRRTAWLVLFRHDAGSITAQPTD